MKILLINKFYYMRGGSETYNFALLDALKKKGHEVICFAMKDEKNIPCDQERFFVQNVDYNRKGIVDKIKAATSFFYNKNAAKQIESLILKERPDVAHIGLIHRQITFSVVDVLKQHNIPIVMTMHDLIFACPNYTMLSNGIVCTDCIGSSVINCVKKKCVKNSITNSVLAAFEKVYLQYHSYYDMIDLYITECEFYKDLMIQSDITKSRIICKTNFLPINQSYGFNSKCCEYILYFGRFSKEKGIFTLLEAQKKLKCKYRMVLVGAGPIQNEIDEYIHEFSVLNIELLGPVYGVEMDRIIEKAKMIVIPSEWYENCPYALLQSMAKGKIVIASNIGGLPELVSEGVTGYLFKPGNSSELAEKIEKVMNLNTLEYTKMSLRICEEAKINHHWEKYIDMLLEEYKLLIKNKNHINFSFEN